MSFHALLHAIISNGDSSFKMALKHHKSGPYVNTVQSIISLIYTETWCAWTRFLHLVGLDYGCLVSK